MAGHRATASPILSAAVAKTTYVAVRRACARWCASPSRWKSQAARRALSRIVRVATAPPTVVTARAARKAVAASIPAFRPWGEVTRYGPGTRVTSPGPGQVGRRPARARSRASSIVTMSSILT
ncbi:hypothetical protein DD630_01960 [Streptomyces sp. BSE7F]|nr:hypothetical protein DD630_01960 [Streptomyces sp. BSE7F]